jgi:outer membrane protein
MNYLRNLSAIVLAAFAFDANAQNVGSQSPVSQNLTATAEAPEVSIGAPSPVRFVQPLLTPFHAQRRPVGPAKLTNTPRLESLVRAGNLYLSVADVIALSLENNLDIAVQRYGPVLAREIVRRAESGQALRDVHIPIAAGPVSISTAGVSTLAIGVGGGSGVTSGGGLVASIGTPPLNLDPTLLAVAQFFHNTTPLANQQVSLVNSSVLSSQYYQVGYSQAWATGTQAQFTFQTQRYQYNSPAYALNPYITGYLDFQIYQQLLQGWGRSANTRYIKVAKNNLKVSDINLKQQVVVTVSAILNLYWDLVSFNDDVHIKEKALETAQQLYEDNKHQAELGTLPAIEVTRAAAQVSQSKEDLLIAQTNVAQQEVILKNALSRTGIASASLDEVHIIPLDSIVVPQKEELKPEKELMTQALAARPEIEIAKINIESGNIQASGTRNALLPNLQAFAEVTNNGLTGSPNALCANLPVTLQASCVPTNYYVGNYGNLLGQVFRRNYPNYSAGFSLNIPFRNRAAQGDYVADLLQQRQKELQLQQVINQVRQDVKNAIVGLQQARARYETAVATRELAQQTLEAEQMRFKFGESSIATVVQAQRDLAGDQTNEIQAMANYTHARNSFDEAVGQTLDVNHISIEEAELGHVAHPSSIPENLPVRKQ